MRRVNTIRTSAAAVALVLASSWVTLGCDGPDEATDLGTLTLALHEGLGDHFRLQILDGPATVELTGEVVFDTGCVEALSRTYELTNLPVGAGRSVLFEGFANDGCAAASRIEVGYRGDVTITQSERPYYHLPIYLERGMSALPEEINLSASVAEPVDMCVTDTDCGGATDVCYTTEAEFWCVPSCVADDDCAGIHPRGTCDRAAGWCMLLSPFPLNLSEPRAMGTALTLESGSVAFVGGVGAVEGGRFTRTTHLAELFDHRTGLFAAVAAEGVDDWPATLSGVTALGGDRVALVGGVTSLNLSWDASTGQLDTAGTAWADVLRDDIVIVDLARGVAATSRLPRAVARPTVVRLGAGRFLVAGGVTGATPAPSRDAWICLVDDALAVTCDAIGPLVTPRAGAAGVCVDGACQQVLIVGGNDAAPVAELLDRSADPLVFAPLAVNGALEKVYEPVLCGLELVSGSKTPRGPSDLRAHTLELVVDGLEVRPDTTGGAMPWLAAVAQAGARCFVGGGLVADGGVSARVLRAQNGALTNPGWLMERPRFGAAAAVVGQGALAGRALFGGGLVTVSPGGAELRLVRGVEVLSP